MRYIHQRLIKMATTEKNNLCLVIKSFFFLCLFCLYSSVLFACLVLHGFVVVGLFLSCSVLFCNCLSIFVLASPFLTLCAVVFYTFQNTLYCPVSSGELCLVFSCTECPDLTCVSCLMRPEPFFPFLSCPVLFCVPCLYLS